MSGHWQIWLGIVGNLAAWAGLIVSRPFTSSLCNVAASTAVLQLLLTYITAFLFVGDSYESIDLRSDLVGSVLITLNSSFFAAISFAASMLNLLLIFASAQERRLRFIAQSTSSGGTVYSDMTHF